MKRLAAMLLVALAACAGAGEEWPGFRGPNRDGTVAALPEAWSEPKLLWKTPVSGECHAGMAIAEGALVTPDHGDGEDCYRCLDAQTGKERWVRSFPNDGELAYGPAPRANPLIWRGRVYVLGAFGDLRCLDLRTGQTLWEHDYRRDFGARGVPTWGFCASPVLLGGRLIIHPRNLVALDPLTGKLLWEGPAAGPNYSTGIAGELGGVEQFITFDGNSLGGWELANGKRLWRLPVESTNGYIVPSPVIVAERLLVIPNPDGAILLGFDDQGRIKPEPVATSDRLVSEVPTPTRVAGRTLASPGLFLLDDSLKPLWQSDRKDRPLRGDVHLIAARDRALAFNSKGQLTLLAVELDKAAILGSARLCDSTMMHPSLADGVIYVRDAAAVYAYVLNGRLSAAGADLR